MTAGDKDDDSKFSFESTRHAQAGEGRKLPNDRWSFVTATMTAVAQDGEIANNYGSCQGSSKDAEEVPLVSSGKSSPRKPHGSSNYEEILESTKEMATFVLTTGSTVSFAILSAIPFVLICKSVLFEMLTGRWYTCLPLVLYRWIVGAATYGLLIRSAHSAVRLQPLGFYFGQRKEKGTHGTVRSIGYVIVILFVSMASAWVHGFAIPAIYTTLRTSSMFQEPDGTYSMDWEGMDRIMFIINASSNLTALVDVMVVLSCFGLLALFFLDHQNKSHGPTCVETWKVLHVLAMLYHGRKWWDAFRTNEKLSLRILQFDRLLVFLAFMGTTVFGTVCITSAYTFFGESSSSSRTTGDGCDPLDTTECLFPFPSNFYTVRDDTTASGLRVSIPTAGLQTMYKGKVPDMSFLNDLDGFSTSAPILFYLQGIKEGQEEFSHNSSVPLLVGPQDDLSKSVTSQSVTLLVDTSRNALVHHFAEIDYLDAGRPSVILQPTQPLRHNTTYAVVVAGAVNVDGQELFPTHGMQRLMPAMTNPVPIAGDNARAQHFHNVLLPSAQEAAPWLQTRTIQLLFDFHTASAESQLGMSRQVRNAMMKHLRSSPPPNVRVIKMQDRERYCPVENSAGRNRSKSNQSVELIARTIHAEVDVAWFLQPWKRNSAHHGRAHVLNPSAVNSSTVVTRPVKVLILVPCSLVQKRSDTTEGQLNAIVDYGHSFMYSRQELAQTFYLQRLAHENGWLLMASDWRGMSRQDSPVLFRMCMSEPGLVRSLRDSLLQSYAERAALQHFARHGLLQRNFLQFHGQPLKWKSAPRYIFYGYSQGGILGGGYSGLMGPTKLLDGVVLESPGSPLALLMSRSVLFPFYRRLLRANLRNNRYVRVAISFIQMAMDSIEVSGLLAPPLLEEHPPTLIQAGFGDTFVTTIGTAFLARAFRASLFPHAVRPVFGLSTVGHKRGQEHEQAMVIPLAFSPRRSDKDEHHAILTEVWYREEMDTMPTINVGQKINDVHLCARQDIVLQEQSQRFINDGEVVDFCARDPHDCTRYSASCY